MEKSALHRIQELSGLFEEKLQMNDSHYDFYKNPDTKDWKEILSFVSKNRLKQVRGLVDHEGNLYVWNQERVIHWTGHRLLTDSGYDIDIPFDKHFRFSIKEFMKKKSGLQVAANVEGDFFSFKFGLAESIAWEFPEGLPEKVIEKIDSVLDKAKQKNKRLQFTHECLVASPDKRVSGEWSADV